MWRRLFLDHPRSVGETYAQHQRNAFAFGGSLLVAGLACLVHGVMPGLFQSTGSRIVERLYDRMVVNRAGSFGHHRSIARSR